MARMDEEPADLAGRLGLPLRQERERRGLTQAGLAARAGVTQMSVSRFESGRRRVSTALADQLFEPLGPQVRVDVEAPGARVDAAIDELRGGPAGRQRAIIADLGLFALRGPRFGYVFDGAAAALLQGVPVVASRIDLLVAEAEVDGLAAWIRLAPAKRYDETWRDFSRYDTDPRDAGPLWWRTGSVEVKVRLVAELPAPVLVTVAEAGGDEHRVAVRALPAVEADFAEVARVLRRLRAR